MTITVRQAMWIEAVTMSITVLVTGIGLAFPLSPFGRATLGDHSVHIALWMAFFLAVVSMIYHLIQLRSGASEHPGAWALALILLDFIAGFLMVSEWQGYRFTQGDWHSAFKVLVVVGPILFLLAMRLFPFLRKLPTTAPTADEVRQWGRLVAVVVMLLAMFAFGIEETKEGHVPSVKWTELPAILIIFVLADFGLELVVLSMESDKTIRLAATAATEAAAGAADAVSKLAEAKTAINNVNITARNSVKTLSTWVGSTHHIEQRLSNGAIRLPELLQQEPDDYFAKLFCFAQSWVPAEALAARAVPSLREETGRLIGDLFAEFVGTNEEDGTVRRFADGVCCITSDAVFAEASKRWLTKITKEHGEPDLIVYAVTTLLPSEFAFPSAYRGRGNLEASGISSLNRFSSAVLRSCANSKVSEYRRITVFEQDKTEMFDKLIQGSGEKPCSLDRWFIFDPRAHDPNGPVDNPTRVLNDCLSVAENRMGIHPLYGLTKDNLKAVFGLSGGQQNGALGQEDTRPDIFPYYDSASSPGVFIIALPEGSMAVFGPVPETVRSPKDSRASCCDWLRQEGWLSLRDWYCKRLHKAPGGEEGAWWAVLDRTSASVIRSFSIEWGQTQVTTLDLLLIGSKGTDGPNWYGAAVSNLTSNRTECTVQLVTNEQRLQSIASSVEQLCNGFRKPADGTQFPVQRFGTWRKWPTAEWSSSEMSAARAAGAGLPLATGRESVATEQSTPQPPKNA